MIDISTAFRPEIISVYDFFQKPGVGFYIPIYQRQYAWDDKNIIQLLDDITKGIKDACNDPFNEIRFLGNIIVVAENDPVGKIKPQDPNFFPSKVENIIDGQQRLSTIAIFAAVLHQHINSTKQCLEDKINKSKLPQIEKDELLKEINEITEYWIQKLRDTYSIDFNSIGSPRRKPKIIRHYEDKWVKEEKTNTSYKSDVALCLFEYIELFEKSIKPSNTKTNSNVSKNIVEIEEWIMNDVSQAHMICDEFVPAQDILKTPDIVKSIYPYKITQLEKSINDPANTNKSQFQFHCCALLQILAACHYLLDRCCLTIIRPSKDDWAFDMFQSLNGTGTPLTAIETFKPEVVYVVENKKIEYNLSVEGIHFSKIENYFNNKNAESKSKDTSNLLTSFAIACSGEKLSSHLSNQRRKLVEWYKKKNHSEDLIVFLGNYAEFINKHWKKTDGSALDFLNGNSEYETSKLLFAFLQDSSHEMAITILGSYYNNYLMNKSTHTLDDFIKALKLVTGFYIHWRSAESNKGLDNAYRNFFNDNKKSKSGSNSGHNWLNNQSGLLEINKLQDYIINTLKDKKIYDRNDWINKSESNLGYENHKSICKIALLVAANDTIPDNNEPGLVIKSKPGAAPYLTYTKYKSDDLKTLEHIAPKINSGNLWDSDLYGNDKIHHRIGNLTLLPGEINTSMSNKGWIEKWFYFSHLAEKSISKTTNLEQSALNTGITLKKETIKMLTDAKYAEHIVPITKVDKNGNWDKALVLKRSKNICELLWDYSTKLIELK
jgi:hypothetical protein